MYIKLSATLLVVAFFPFITIAQECLFENLETKITSLPNYTSPTLPCMYSGFLPLDAKRDSALFYWFFESETASADAPIIVWINGGPGIREKSISKLKLMYMFDSYSPLLRRIKYDWTLPRARSFDPHKKCN
jgi:hypothetical protein